MTSTPFTLRWGILATGGIAETFTQDLLIDPTSRDVHDVHHVVVAAASSSSQQRAAEFLQRVSASPDARAYGSYAALVADPDVDIVYVATPHSHHFQNAMLVLEAGKPVLCEKAFTVTAAQARKLVATARAKRLFLMEAVWTRFFPLSVQIRNLVQSGAIGTVYRVVADNSFESNASSTVVGGPLTFGDNNRMVNRDLAGGATLDLGIYSLTWLFQILYHLQSDAKEAPRVVAVMNKYATTGADESDAIILQFPRHASLGVALTSLRVDTSVDAEDPSIHAILIQGSGGEIQVAGPAFRPQKYRLVTKSKTADGKTQTTNKLVECPIPRNPRPEATWSGHGMFWEADECARCLRDGRLESTTLPLDESIVIMETMEEALRQGDIVYPEVITTDVFDKNSPLNLGRA